MPSSSSSSFENSYICEKVVPKMTSLWKKQHLENLGIFYSESPSSTNKILDIVKRQVVDLHMEELPEIGQKLIELTKMVFDFSFNFNDPLNSEKNLRKLKIEMERTCKNFESFVNDFKDQNRDLIQERINERVFQTWVTYASEFLSYLRIFTVRYQMLETRKGTFAQLLIQFTRLCLLVPENGDSLMSTVKLNGKPVFSIPDLRFPCHESGDVKTVKVVTMAEVKHSDDNSFNIANLSDDVLGQHGAELLLEYYKSLFRPVVSGLICMGTKLIFTVLQIDGKDYASLQTENAEGIDRKSTIMHSEPYDFMNSYDRNDILNICFWFGFVQHNAYKSVMPF